MFLYVTLENKKNDYVLPHQKYFGNENDLSKNDIYSPNNSSTSGDNFDHDLSKNSLVISQLIKQFNCDKRDISRVMIELEKRIDMFTVDICPLVCYTQQFCRQILVFLTISLNLITEFKFFILRKLLLTSYHCYVLLVPIFIKFKNEKCLSQINFCVSILAVKNFFGWYPILIVIHIAIFICFLIL